MAIKDIAAFKRFYEKILNQNVVMDIGVHVAFDGFSLQRGYVELVGLADDRVRGRSHNFQIYFEVDDLDEVYTEMKSISGLQWVHGMKECPWGQRNIRVYNPDKHIIEIAEDMATRTMFPLESMRWALVYKTWRFW